MTQLDTFEPDGRAISYADEGQGPALVLIPGRGADGGVLGTLASIILEEDFRVVRIGARATSDESDLTFEELAQDVIDVLDHIGIDHAWVGGHGFGGSVARAVSAHHSDRVNGVLLLGVEDRDIPLSPIVPVMVLQGTDDDVTPPANGDALQASAPTLVSVTPIEGAGHMFPMTHAGETAAVIEDYLDWD